jgi:hypothetical protein
MNGGSIVGLGQDHRLTLEDAPAETDIDVLPHALEEYNDSQWPEHLAWRPLAVFVRGEGQIVAGYRGILIAAGYSSNTCGCPKSCAAEALGAS